MHPRRDCLKGYVRHHAIVVTGWSPAGVDRPTIHDARAAAVTAGCMLVTEVVGPGVNGTTSFMVAPDGSREGWGDSDEGDRARDRFIEWLRGRHDFSWAEIVLGADDAEAHVERHAWEDETNES